MTILGGELDGDGVASAATLVPASVALGQFAAKLLTFLVDETSFIVVFRFKEEQL